MPGSNSKTAERVPDKRQHRRINIFCAVFLCVLKLSLCFKNFAFIKYNAFIKPFLMFGKSPKGKIKLLKDSNKIRSSGDSASGEKERRLSNENHRSLLVGHQGLEPWTDRL